MSKVVPLLETIFQNKGGSPQLWKATNEVLLTRSDEARHFCAYMKRKVRDMNKDVQLLALDFLDYSIDDGKMPLWTQVSSKDFLTNLVNILKTRDDNDVQNKILYLIEKWGRRFEKYNNIIPNFTSYYKNLKDNGIEFPQNYQSNYQNYVGNIGINNEYDNSNYNQNSNNLDPSDFEKKYKKLVLKLNEMINAMNQVNQFIQNSQNSNYDIGNLRGIISDIKSGEKQLIETIQGDRLKDEKLMEISLHVTEDIKKTLTRYEDLKKGNIPQSFNSNQNNNNNNQVTFDILEGFGNNNNQGNNNNNKQGTVNDLLDIFSNPNTNNNPNQNLNSGMNIQFQNNNNINNMNMFSNNMNQNNMMNMGMNQNNMMNMGMNQSNNMMNMGMGNMQTQNNQNNFMNQMMGNNNINNMNLNNQNNNGMNFDFGMGMKQNTNQSNNLFDMGMSNNQNQFNTNTNNNMNFLNMGMNTNTNQNMNNNMFGNNGGNNNNLFNF
jgi:hypothetical protein